MLNMGMKNLTIALVLTAVGLLHAPAVQADEMLAGAQACTRHLPKAERYHNIPTHWLAAIATTESGRYHKGIGLSLPWPWTINVKGKGYYFDTKQEALAKIKEYQSKGVKSIDVGCMQVNMRYHGHAFSDVSQALEPRYNVAYAARFLRENYDDMHSWKKATAAYHSKTPSRGSKYFGTVYRKWEKVVKKLGASANSESLHAERPAIRKVASSKKYTGFKVNEHKTKQKTVKMKTIKVADALAKQKSPSNNNAKSARSYQNGVAIQRTLPPLVKDYQYQPKVVTPGTSSYGLQSYNESARYQPALF